MQVFFFFKSFLLSVMLEMRRWSSSWLEAIVSIGWMGRKIIFPVLFLVLCWDVPVINDRLTGKGTNKSLISCTPSIYLRDTQENWVTPTNGPSNHLKYHLQPKSKEDVEVGVGAVMGGDQEKPSKQGWGCYAALSPCLLHWWVSRDLEHLPLSKRERPFQMEDSRVCALLSSN